MEELVLIVQTLQRRVEELERLLDIRNVVIPADGKLVVESRASDPAAEKGRIYFNTTVNKYRVSEDGLTWKTITTA